MVGMETLSQVGGGECRVIDVVSRDEMCVVEHWSLCLSLAAFLVAAHC